MDETQDMDDGFQDKASALDDWTALIALPRDGMWGRIKAWSYYLMSPRMRARRVLDLKAGRGAKALDAFLSKRSRGRVKALRTYALVNQEQAAAALRMTVIANATIPIAFVTVLTQISDGQIWASATLWDGVRDLYVEDPVFFGFLAAVCLLSFFVLFWLLAYSATRMGQARDVRHCIDLHVAERGVFFGLEDEAELP